MAKKLQVFGNRGKSAYQYALDGGYTGSEAEFKEKMARELKVAYDYEDLNNKILATAIKQEASGTVISVSDAAAIPLLGLDYEGENVTFTVSGKNVLPPIGSEGWFLGSASVATIESGFTPVPSNFTFAANQYSEIPAYVLKTNGKKEIFIKVPNNIYCVTIAAYSSYEDVTDYTKRLQTRTDIVSDTVVKFSVDCEYLIIAYSNFSITTEQQISAEDVFATFDVDDISYEPYTAKTITVASPDKLNLNDFVMNSPNTVITNDKNVPMTIQYVADPQIYINNLANSLTNAVVSLGGEV